MESFPRRRGIVLGTVGVEDVFEWSFLVVILLCRSVVILDMFQQLGQRSRVKAHLLQFVGKPLDALLELRVRDGGIDPLWREALIPESLLE
jgi:hypothetical protein